MSKIPFKYYLHDSSFYESHDELKEQDSRFTDELLEDMGRPFYEVTLYCEVDEDTGDVTILRVE